jgi:hypothetical protein
MESNGRGWRGMVMVGEENENDNEIVTSSISKFG